MKTIKQIYKIKAPVDRVWQALVDPALIEKWGGGPANMAPIEGYEFTLWGGDVHGKNLKVEDYKLLIQDWADNDLPTPTPVEFSLSVKDNHTVVVMKQTNIPESRIDDLTDGWKRYYLGPLKKLVESM